MSIGAVKMDTEETISLIDSLSNVNNYPDPRSVNVVQSHTDSENVQTETGDRETINNVDEKVDNSLVTELAPSSNFTIKDCSNGLPQSDEGDREMVPIKCDELDGADTADKSFQDTNKQVSVQFILVYLHLIEGFDFSFLSPLGRYL